MMLNRIVYGGTDLYKTPTRSGSRDGRPPRPHTTYGLLIQDTRLLAWSGDPAAQIARPV